VVSAMRKLATVLGALWILNLVVYIGVAVLIGGDAINGHIDSGHYFLATHGRLTEVTRATFEYSRWHTYILWVHFLVAFGLAGWLWIRSAGWGRAPNNRWRGP
jgi:hypothetical protein